MPIRRPPLAVGFPTLDFENQLDFLLLELQEQDELVESGVASVGKASAYALVWEWGNVRQTQKGPKTTMGINPDGSRVWLSIQAPFGYIRINTPQYFKILEEEMSKVQFISAKTSDVSDALRTAAARAATRIAALIRDTVPVDSGDLRASIQVVSPSDYVTLDQAEEDGALVFRNA